MYDRDQSGSLSRDEVSELIRFVVEIMFSLARVCLTISTITGNQNVVDALRRARLVLGWVTVRGYTILVFNQSHPGLLTLAILLWVEAMSTGDGLANR